MRYVRSATLPYTRVGVCLFLYSNLTFHITLYYTHTISLSFTLICSLALSFHPEDCSIVLPLAPESVHPPTAAVEESTCIATGNSPAIEQCECEYSGQPQPYYSDGSNSVHALYNSIQNMWH